MRFRLIVGAPFALTLLGCTGLFGTDTGDTAGGACTTGYHDQDGDGYGDPDRPEPGCPAGTVDNGDDCDDADPGVHPGADEVCDDVDADEDCNGTVEEDDPGLVLTVWFADADHDGFGDPGATQSSCDQPSGYVADDQDCDDTDRAVNPDGEEICDGGTDEDCDGLVDADDDSVNPDIVPTWYSDGDGDGYGDPEGAQKEQCPAPSGYAANAEDCDDGDASVNPGEAEVCGNGVDDDCDGGAVGCPRSGTYTSSEANATITGTGSETLGHVVAVGDQNGDGLDDLACSGTDAAYLFYAGTRRTLSSTSADVKFTQETSGGDSFGWSMAAGDLDHDGDADLAIADASYDYSSSYSSTGRVYVFTGPHSASEPASGANTTYTANTSKSLSMGERLAVGDWNGDGKDDLFASSLATTVFGDLGSVSSGSRDLPGLNEWETTVPEGIVPELTADGDTDGDGIVDLATGTQATFYNRGAIWLTTGGWTGVHALSGAYLDFTVTGDDEYDDVGSSFTLGGDWNEDGYADLFAGAPGDKTHSAGGTAAIFYGPLSGTHDLGDADVFVSTDSNETLGYSVRYLGDEDGDGHVDLVVGAPGNDLGGSDAGRVLVWRGPASGDLTTAAADATFTGETGAYFGNYVAAIGDWNGDGLADMAVGTGNGGVSPQTFLFFGGDL